MKCISYEFTYYSQVVSTCMYVAMLYRGLLVLQSFQIPKLWAVTTNTRHGKMGTKPFHILGNGYMTTFGKQLLNLLFMPVCMLQMCNHGNQPLTDDAMGGGC